jgi:predicted nuclease of predicted toxin-antitoxin system
LFDQNISPRIIKQLSTTFPDSTQVRFVGPQDTSDFTIFEFARKNDYAIVTFDSDFVDLNVVKGIPPKIIWIKTGNLTTKSIFRLLHKNMESIHKFLEAEEQEILELID